MVTPPKGDVASVPLNRRRDEGRQRVGSRDRRLVPGLRRRRADADADAAQHHLAERRTIKIETDAGQQTRRLLFDGAAGPGAASLQGYLGGASGSRPQRPRRRRRRRCRAGGNLKVTTTQLDRRLAAQERRALQRERDGDGVLRSLHGAQQRRVAGRDDDRVRPEVSEPGLRHEHALQEGSDGSKWSPSPCRPT